MANDSLSVNKVVGGLNEDSLLSSIWLCAFLVIMEILQMSEWPMMLS